MMVIDASAVVDVLTDREPGVAVALEISEHKELWAPELMMVEVASAFWRLTRTGLLKAPEADRAVARLGQLPVTLVGHALCWRMRGPTGNPFGSVMPSTWRVHGAWVCRCLLPTDGWRVRSAKASTFDS